MNARNKIKNKTILTFAAIAAILIVFGGSVQAELLVYEPFDYTDQAIVNGTAATGAGLTGTWSSNKTDTNCRFESSGLTYGDLPTAAGRIRFNVNSSPWAQVSIDPSVLAGHLDDGDVLWFSMIYHHPSTTGTHYRFMIGADSNNGLGFRATRSGSFPSWIRSIQAMAKVGGAETLSPVDNNYDWDSTDNRLIVGKITFGEIDKLEVFMPSVALELPPALATITANIDQSTFGEIRFIINNGNSAFADEVRIGTSYVEVIGTPYAPEAIAGYSVSTWSGEPVTMAPTVVNNDPNEPVAPLNYLWTVEESVGVDVVVSDPTIEAPIVTATRITPYWWEVPIENPSFEDPVLADPDGRYKWFMTGESTWRFADPDGTAFTTADNKGYFGQMFLWNPGAEDLGLGWNGPGLNGEAADGVNCVIVGSILRSGDDVGPVPASAYPGGLAQLLTTTYDPTASYELSAYIGHSDLNFSRQGGYRVELLAGGSNENSSAQYTHKVVGGTVIGSVESTDPIDPETWIPVTVPVAANAANADLAGEPLQIRFTSLRIPDDPNTTYIEVDDVKLMTDAPLLVQTVTMKLSVNNEGSSNLPSASLMNIDVYDDACEMTKAVTPEAISGMDFDNNCVINLNDFAVLVTKWLDDYSSTEPVAIQP